MSDNTLIVHRLEKEPGETVIQRVIDVLDSAFAESTFTQILCCNQTQLRQDMFSMYVRAALVGGEVWVAGYGSSGEKKVGEKVGDMRLETREVVGAAVWFGPGQEMLGGASAMEQAKQGWFTFQAKLPNDGVRSWWMEFISEYSNFTHSSLSRLPSTRLGSSYLTSESPPTSPTSNFSSFGVSNAAKSKTHDWKLHNWHLEMIGVLPEFQDKGVGRAMLGRVMAKAKSEHTGVCLETDSVSALRLYDRLGFKEHGRTILHGHHGEEDVGPDGTTPTEPLETIMICLAIQPDEIYF